jgi:hypothetical protein
LKKLVDFINNWGDSAGGRLDWGDKGLAGGLGVNFPGTSSLRQGVGDIRMEGWLYRGMGAEEEH